MDRGRRDRPLLPGLRVAGGGDLIEDIHRQQRRRLLKRAAQITALAIVLLLIGVGIKIFKDRHARAEALTAAYAHFLRGTPAEIDEAAAVLGRSIAEEAADHAETLVARALVLAHLRLEVGEGDAAAREAVAALDESTPGAALARGVLAFADGDLDTARAALEADQSILTEDPVGPFVQTERVWLLALLAVAQHPDDAEALDASVAALRERLEAQPELVALRRQLVFTHVVAGDATAAQAEFEIAREHGRSHVGLSADEALLNAYLHQKLSGVASVADQLLDPAARGRMSPHDRARARLARAVVHVHSGETSEGLAMLDEAWEGLPAWDRLSRRLAIQSSLEAGDAARIEAWVKQTPLPESEGEIYRAWAVLVGGDVMEALRRLAELPQRDPWVAFLQSLALVEQRRFTEAGPWIERTEKLLPGRLEIEVARARVQLRDGDKKVALRTLTALAEEEARAPRAWTGLGEAHLLQEGEPDLDAARKALRRAIEREPLPAEAMLLLAEVWDGRRGKDPDAERKARELLEKAAKTNEFLPRYGERLAMYLSDIGFPEPARERMESLVDEPGVGWPLVLRLCRLQAEAEGPAEYDPEPLFAKARDRGAPPVEITRLQAWLDVDSGDRSRVSKAQQDLEALLTTNPQDVDARVLYARTFLKQYDRKAAESAIRRGLSVLEDDSKDGRLLFAWAEIEARTGKARLAAPRARRAWLHMRDENRPPSELLDVADLATRLWLRVGKERSAVTLAEQLTDRLGYHSQAWTIRARTELSAGEAGAARESAVRAIGLDANNPRAHEIHGHSLLRYGLKDKARAAYESALKLVEGTPSESDYRANFKRL
ncbi:MAG: tetratricopeptide repeat protein [Deltaproteobacteria bacterium]|nr:tetratricopeptide repeat protein [Deltaproteobacteria bacterium]